MNRLGSPRSALLLALLLSPWVTAQEQTEERRTDMTDRQKVIHLLNRCAFGPRPGQVEEVMAMGWEAWVEKQLQPERIPDYFAEKRVEDLRSLRLNCRQLVDTYYPQEMNDSEAERRRVRELREVPRKELMTAVLFRAVDSDCQLQEVMCNFWRNHFNVSMEKDDCQYITADYEREVIRKYVFGRFEDMLMASAKHPAMLIYLDNQVSQRPLNKAELEALAAAGPNKPAHLRLRTRGLNENYARELLELHTLGVDNGYTQADVWDLARVLTGWTIDRDSYTFAFRSDVHDIDKKKILGKQIKAINSGPEEGEMVIKALAADKRTHRFIAWKMCRYLLDDNPPEEMVERVAKVFKKTDGDLREVTKAIIYDPEFFKPQYFRSKFKTPFEFAVSMFRAMDCIIEKPEPVFEALTRMRQPIYHCEDPTGYYDQAEAWLDPGVMATRWQFALDMVTSTGALRIPDEFYVQVEGAITAAKLRDALAMKLLNTTDITPTTKRVLDKICVQSAGGDAKKLQLRLTGILLGCPEFQRQ